MISPNKKKAEADLEQTNKKLLCVSRLAGMSEIATGVLHNVGNVLNSLNVTANLLTEKLSKSKVHDLKKAGDLVSEHLDDLGAFVTEHAQGKYFAQYIIEIGKHLAREQDDIYEDLEAVRKNIEHIKEIVSTQQSYGRISGVKEKFSPEELVEETLKMRSVSFNRHSIEVVRDFTYVPSIIAERHKILQILVNLIGNAKHAISDHRSTGGRLTLRLYMVGKDRFRFEVTDDGIGISKENMAKIFTYGFTTKKDGHGFGLHSSALVAKELGGTLTAHSDGTGATFTLELPLRQDQSVEVNGEGGM